MAKKLKAIVRLQLEAGKANPAPPVGPALAGHGINIMAFCKEYNARTSNRPGEVLPAEITSLHRWLLHLCPEDLRLPQSCSARLPGSKRAPVCRTRTRSAR